MFKIKLIQNFGFKVGTYFQYGVIQLKVININKESSKTTLEYFTSNHLKGDEPNNVEFSIDNIILKIKEKSFKIINEEEVKEERLKLLKCK